MKALITGAGGQVGRALLERAPSHIETRALTRTELDIGDPSAVSSVVTAFRPDLIINAAAYTAVDKAETEPDLAANVNERGPGYLARAALTVPGCRLLHISTDYVFDGHASSAYKPADARNPLSVYGETKMRGEAAVLGILGDRAAVLRTAWVYAPYGKNFVLTMLRLMRERGEVRVVADQRGTPTSADSIAGALWALASRPSAAGVLHWTDAGVATWFEFAVAIAEEGRIAGLLDDAIRVTPITTAEYPTPAHRPRNSVLDCTAAITSLGVAPAPWRSNLRAMLARLQ